MRDLRLDDPMHYMMDCASGISPQRAARYRRHPAQELLGDVNWEYETLCDVWQAPDLGPEFRAPLVSAIPTLIVHGTWDTSTPIENAREVIAGLSNGHLVEVIGGGHGALYDLDRSWPPMRERLAAFLRGERVRFPTSVTLPPVELSPRGGG
jgi:pimeloyl-ACP methyl ester carboxylesterase